MTLKLLYGIQGTGNGHITRARELSRYFDEYDIEVDYLFSGRAREAYFDMACFGDDWACNKGLTFAYKSGKLCIWDTLHDASASTFLRDVKSLDLSPFDAVLTDFEPITAWAAKRQNKTCIGVGHQYAFLHDVPKAGDNLLTRNIMRQFAPADIALGLHWDAFGAPILPPIAHVETTSNAIVEPEKILVYLGFESPEEVIPLLEQFPSTTFVYYGPFSQYESIANIQLKPLSREGFKHDLTICNGVISNAGFELASEAIQLGKKLLVKPLKGQTEQMSNALALETLNLGLSMDCLCKNTIRLWLNDFQPQRIEYPNVARAIVEWIAKGHWSNTQVLAERLWSQTHRRVSSTASLSPRLAA